MSKKSNLKKAIAESEAEIESLEKRRVRSQSAILESYVNHTEPSETDAEYFRMFTELIELERANLRKLNEELEKLEG